MTLILSPVTNLPHFHKLPFFSPLPIHLTDGFIDHWDSLGNKLFCKTQMKMRTLVRLLQILYWSHCQARRYWATRSESQPELALLMWSWPTIIILQYKYVQWMMQVKDTHLSAFYALLKSLQAIKQGKGRQCLQHMTSNQWIKTVELINIVNSLLVCFTDFRLE